MSFVTTHNTTNTPHIQAALVKDVKERRDLELDLNQNLAALVSEADRRKTDAINKLIAELNKLRNENVALVCIMSDVV